MSGLLFLLIVAAVFWGAQDKPPRPPGPDAADHLADVRHRFEAMKPIDSTARRALEYSRLFLNRADKSSRSGQPFTTDRMAEAADALLHVAEHEQHLHDGGGPKGPATAAAIQDHLQRVYFRIQQADYFLNESHDQDAASFPRWARNFYQLAVRASEGSNFAAADENAKCADEIVRALESLAQAAAPPPAVKAHP